jgi:drug/metabolite transporter (DMT)-like permease
MGALLAASIEPIIVKFGFRGHLSPWHLFTLKSVFAAVLCFAVCFLFKFKLASREQLKKLAVSSVLLIGTNIFTMFALYYISAVTVITVVTTTPALVAVLNQRLGRDQLDKLFWPGFWLSFIGVLLSIELSQFMVQPLGLVLMFGAVITSSFYRVQMERLTDEISPAVISACTMAVGAVFSLLFILPFNYNMPASAWYFGVWIGIAAGLANIAFLYAINTVGATRISVITMLQRPLLIIAAAVLLKEPVTIPQMIGIVLVIAGTQMARVTRLQPQQAEAHALAEATSNAQAEKPQTAPRN